MELMSLVVNPVRSNRWKSSANDLALSCLNWLPVNYLRNTKKFLCLRSLVKTEHLREFESRSVKT